MIEVLNYVNYGVAHIYLFVMQTNDDDYIFGGMVLLKMVDDYRMENFMVDRSLENLINHYQIYP